MGSFGSPFSSESRSETRNTSTSAAQTGAGEEFEGTNLNFAGLEIGNANKADNNRLDLTVETVDYNTVDRAFTLGESTLEAGFNTIEGVIDANADANLSALVFAGQAGNAFITDNRRARNDAYTFAGQAGDAAYSLAEHTFDESVDFLEGTRALVESTANAALVSAHEFAGLVHDNARETVGAIERQTNQSLTFAGQAVAATQDFFATGVDQIAEISTGALENVQGFSAAAIDKFQEATRSDADKNSERVVQVAIVGMIAVAVGFGIMRARG